MQISFDIDVTGKQADDLASEIIALLIEADISILNYEVTS